MSKLIIKDGGLCIVGGQIVTDEDGAPCVCGPGGCWIIASNCNCDCPVPLYVFLLTPELELAWPYEDRINGVVARIGEGICVEYMGASNTLPAGQNVQVMGNGAVLETFPSCDSGECGDDTDCTDNGGFVQQTFNNLGSCGFPGWTTDCLQRMVIRVRMRGTRTFKDFSNPQVEESHTISTDTIHIYERVGETQQRSLVDWATTSTSIGFRRVVGQPESSWNYSGQYTMTDPGSYSGVPPVVAMDTYAQAVPIISPADAPMVLTPISARSTSSIANAPCNGNDTVNEPGSTGVFSESRNISASRISGSVSGAFREAYHQTEQEIDTEEIVNATHSVSFSFITTNGDVIEEDSCDDRYMLAVKCDDPGAQIIFDPSTRSENGLTMFYDGDRYYSTDQLIRGEAVDVVWSDDPCDTVIPLIARKCDDDGDTVAFDPSERPQSGVTLLYQGDRYYPTTEQASDPAESVTWDSGQCPSNIDCTDIESFTDPRCLTPEYFNCPQCRGLCFGITGPSDPRCNDGIHNDCPQCFDGTQVDPPVDPNDPAFLSTRPGLGDTVESAIKAATFGKVPTCAGCQRRKEALNRLGQGLRGRLGI